MDNGYALWTENLGKQYGDRQAVRSLSFAVNKGEIFSLLGPNGAGKSTTISMLSGLLRPSAGDAWIHGHSVLEDGFAAKGILGVVPQEIAVYSDLTARENLVFWGKMYGLRGEVLRRRVDSVLQMVGLAERQREPVGRFSGGMKRRLNLGIALLHEPRVLIMDEPTVGIDPQSRRNILDSIKELNRQGMTVLYTTHYMEEAQELSDHIAIMDQGTVIACGTHAELVKIVGEVDRIELRLGGPAAEVAEAWAALPGVRSVVPEPPVEGNGHESRVTLLADDSDTALPRLFEVAAQAGLHILAVEVREPNLEAVFLHLTGKGLRDG